MSDRDGYWDSDWDPEVGIDPPNDRDCYCDERYYDCDLPDDTYAVVFSIGREAYLLLENRQWTEMGIMLTAYPKGMFHTDQKCIAEHIAAQYRGWVMGVNLKTKDPVAPVGLKTFDELMQLKQEFLKKEEELKQQVETKRIEQEKEYERKRIEQEKEREKERIEQEEQRKRNRKREEEFWGKVAKAYNASVVFYKGKLMCVYRGGEYGKIMNFSYVPNIVPNL